MSGISCFIRAKDGEWMQLEECHVSVNIKRRLERTLQRGGEGDDLKDEGSESAVYTVRLIVDNRGYKVLEGLFRAGQPSFIDPFIDREMLVAIQEMSYDSETGEVELVLIEDVEA
ncbi:MAG: hypothetical protein QGH13_02070 [Candidatus Thalassarchaeaceae archaeon]|nr:hypothetical protein [Candidatus Thalassarchaeaceae archaeon]|tara:strand:+ start:155 stop:499 length:345 start_codon:yes stop_codon:yes gene_type:complete